MNKSKFLSKFSVGLKEKLYFISIGMVLFITVAVFIPFQKGIEDQKASKRDGFVLYYNNLSNTLSELFYTNYNNVQSFARNKDLKEKNVEASTFLLNELVTLYPDTDMIFLVGLDGKLIAHSDIDNAGKKLNSAVVKSHDFKQDTWFQQTSKGKYVENYDKKIFGAYAGEVQKNEMLSKVYGHDKMGQFFSTLIEDEYGEPIAVLGAFVGSRWFESELKNLYKVLSENGMSSAEVHLLKKDGIVISSYSEKYEAKNVQLHDYKNYNLTKKIIRADQKEFNKDVVDTIIHDQLLGNDKTQYLYSFGQIKNRKFLEAMGWKLVIGMTEKQAYGEIISLQNLFYVTLTIVFILCCIVSFITVKNLYTQLLDVVARLEGSAKSTLKFVEELNGVSHRVSDLSSTQAQAIHETASTLDELSSMVKMNAQNAVKSVDISRDNEGVAVSGKDKVGEVVRSMSNIQQANEEVLKTTTDGSQKISEIVNLINEINEKTQVINDIVFQTKLLSFNASVEAARAGEHGKGFAVVAEEVGNLAAMSGKASEEINTILAQSVTYVEKIVKENQQSIQQMIDQSKMTIQEGITISNECSEALSEIVEGVKNVSLMSHEISSATTEQESGVANISSAMNQLQGVAQDNTEIAAKTLQYSEELNRETQNLQSVLSTLQNEIIGGVKKTSASNIPKGKGPTAKKNNVLEIPEKNNQKLAS